MARALSAPTVETPAGTTGEPSQSVPRLPYDLRGGRHEATCKAQRSPRQIRLGFALPVWREGGVGDLRGPEMPNGSANSLRASHRPPVAVVVERRTHNTLSSPNSHQPSRRRRGGPRWPPGFPPGARRNYRICMRVPSGELAEDGTLLRLCALHTEPNILRNDQLRTFFFLFVFYFVRVLFTRHMPRYSAHRAWACSILGLGLVRFPRAASCAVPNR